MQEKVKYSPVDDTRRHRLINLIYEEKISIRQAAILCNISYPTAKAINRIFVRDGRIEKKKSRDRGSSSRKIKASPCSDNASALAKFSKLPKKLVMGGKRKTEQP